MALPGRERGVAGRRGGWRRWVAVEAWRRWAVEPWRWAVEAWRWAVEVQRRWAAAEGWRRWAAAEWMVPLGRERGAARSGAWRAARQVRRQIGGQDRLPAQLRDRRALDHAKRSSRTFPGQACAWRAARRLRRDEGAPRLSSFRRHASSPRNLPASEADPGDPLAERRDDEGDAVQPEVEVLAEGAARDLRLEIAAGRRHEAEVELAGVRPAMRSTFRSSRTRSSFAWKARGSSPISSRNSVPPWAARRRPGRGMAGAREGALRGRRAALSNT